MIIRDTVTALEIGPPETFRNLTLFPLFGPVTSLTDYITLDEALAAGCVHVTELSQGGSVPELLLVNDGDRAVFLLDGEELVGAKQNRTINLSILAAAHSKLKLPVTCVEAGRWEHTSAEFAASPRAHYAAGRAQKQRNVTESLCLNETRFADQSGVWRDIDAKAARMAAPSPTHAMAGIYIEHEVGVEAFVAAFTPKSDQRGAVFAIDGAIVGLDLFDRADTLSKLLPKIIQSYALDALDTVIQTSSVSIADVDAITFLESIGLANARAFPALGLGEDVRLEAPGLSGGALVADCRVVHMSCFVANPVAGA